MEKDLFTLGNDELLKMNTITFLCSHKVPDETFGAIRQWIDTLNPQKDCVICGCLAGIEKFTLKYLVQKRIPIILALAETLPNDVSEISKRLNDIVLSESMGSGRLLIISCISNKEQTNASGKSAEMRNTMMMNLGRTLVVGYASPLGNLSRQLLLLKDVTYLVNAQQKATQTSNEGKTNDEHEQKVQMGWGIYNALKENYATLGSLEVRRLLNQYLKLGINEPSRLHSLILLLVVKNIDVYPDLKFTPFFKLWGVENLQDEDWKAHKVNDHWVPSLAERVTGKLFRFPQGGSSKDLDKELIRAMIKKGMERNPNNKKFPQYAEKLTKIENWRPKSV